MMSNNTTEERQDLALATLSEKWNHQVDFGGASAVVGRTTSTRITDKQRIQQQQERDLGAATLAKKWNITSQLSTFLVTAIRI